MPQLCVQLHTVQQAVPYQGTICYAKCNQSLFLKDNKTPFFITGIHSTNKGILCPFCSATRKKKLSLPKIICSVEVEGMWAYPTDVQRLLEDRGLSSEPRSSEVSPLVPRLCVKREHTYSENFGYIKLLWQPIPNDEIESDILR